MDRELDYLSRIVHSTPCTCTPAQNFTYLPRSVEISYYLRFGAKFMFRTIG